MSLPSFPRHERQPVTHGASGDQVWRLTGPSELYLKRSAFARDEAERVQWLAAQGIPAPELVDVGDDWLVTTAVPGRAAHEPWSATELPAVVDAIADITLALHALDVTACPFDRTTPHDADLVVCHGDLCLPNVLLDPATLEITGFVDLARLGVTDRYVDLAIATRSMALHPDNTQFGAPMAQRFLDRYGVPDPDVGRVELYRELDDLA